VVISLERGAELHMAQCMPLPLTISCFSKIQIGFTFLALTHLSCPGKGPLNGCCCCCNHVNCMLSVWHHYNTKPVTPGSAEHFLKCILTALTLHFLQTFTHNEFSNCLFQENNHIRGSTVVCPVMHSTVQVLAEDLCSQFRDFSSLYDKVYTYLHVHSIFTMIHSFHNYIILLQ